MRKSFCLALLCIVLACTDIFPAFAMEVPAQESTYTAADSKRSVKLLQISMHRRIQKCNMSMKQRMSF